MRLWNMADENNLQLLEEDQFGLTLEASGIEDKHAILIEIRNRDMSWPEEMTSLALNKTFQDKRPQGKGMTGLSNLGNTCFMNSAIQCMSSTIPLTSYFTDGYHMYELNKTNPLGMKGNIAKRYGEVVQDLWSGNCRSIAPLKLRWTIGRYAPRFNGFQQQDSQEFLAFLLDGLHEDLNRVHSKPYVELKDSDGRPDEEVAKEAWDNHLKRNKSIVVDLFQGQLKSCVRCLQCDHVSVRFDPYTFLSLPIPMDNSIYVECIVVTLNGLVPIKYGLLLSADDKYKKLKKHLAKLCGLMPKQILMAEVFGATVKGQPLDGQKVRSSLSGILYAFEIPPPPAVENTISSSSAVATSNESTADRHTGGEASADTPLNEVEFRVVERPTIVTDLPTIVTDRPTIVTGVPMVRAELTRSPSRSSSERSLGGSLKLPCLSRQTSDDDDDEDNIEVGSEVSGRSNMGLLRQLSPRFIRKLTNRKQGNGWNASEGSGGTSELNNLSPTCSAKTTPGHSRNTSVSSTSGTPLHAGVPQISQKPLGYVFGMHRKLMRMDVYFIAPQKNRPSLFGCPLIIPCTQGTNKAQLYSCVWQQVSRFISAPPPGEESMEDRDSGYPFKLKAVSEDGLNCAVCPWFKFCRGCTIECNDEEFNCNCQCIAIEWEPTTLHLRYQSSQEKVFTEHESLERSQRLQSEPIDLYECFKAFTKEEELGEDELWYCSKCKEHQLASKKLDIWCLPPILIIHLKRFQFMNGRWVKSNKVVNFPTNHFDPSEFVVKRSMPSDYNLSEDCCSVRTVNVKTVDSEDHACCSEVVLETKSDKDLVPPPPTLHEGSSDSGLSSNSSRCGSDEADLTKQDCTELNEDSDYSSQSGSQTGTHQGLHSGKVHPTLSNKSSNKLPVDSDGAKDCVSLSTNESSETASIVCNETAESNICCASKVNDVNCVGINSVDLLDVDSVNSSHEVLAKLENGSEQDSEAAHMLYNLYAISSHTGVMGGGHYVSFSTNRSGKWYCFNDSSCKETTSERVKRESPYLLFYEHIGMEHKKFQPDVEDRTPESANDDDELDSEFKKACVLQ